jgi:hypothetical protein
MADRHESLVRSFRQCKANKDFKSAKCPMPTYRPDVFGCKLNKLGDVVAQVAVEAEIESTLFSEHTSHQLLLMDEFIHHQAQKKVKVFGYLVIPKGKTVFRQASAVLEALFPEGTQISIMQF